MKSNIEQPRIVAYLDSVQAQLASHKGMISLRELQSASGEELSVLMPSVLDRTSAALLLLLHSMKPFYTTLHNLCQNRGRL